jgi:hypothetical protein
MAMVSRTLSTPSAAIDARATTDGIPSFPSNIFHNVTNGTHLMDVMLDSLSLAVTDDVCVFNDVLMGIDGNHFQGCCDDINGHGVAMSEDALNLGFLACQYNATDNTTRTDLVGCALEGTSILGWTNYFCFPKLERDIEASAGIMKTVGIMGWVVTGLSLASSFGLVL